MVYLGGDYCVVPISTWPLALPPLSVQINCSQPMSPVQNSSIQVNMISDCTWTQLDWFNDVTQLNGTDGQPLQMHLGQVGFGVDTFNVAPAIEAPNFVVYQPTGLSDVPNVPISDVNGNPIECTDMLNGGWSITVELLANTWIALMRGPSGAFWSYNRLTPTAMVGAPKAIEVVLVGWGQVSLGSTWSSGTFSSSFTATQTHDQYGNLIEPYPIQMLNHSNPSYVDPNGVTLQYANATGETANLTPTLVPNNAYSFTVNASPNN